MANNGIAKRIMDCTITGDLSITGIEVVVLIHRVCMAAMVGKRRER
jgi:hypothetical protein